MSGIVTFDRMLFVLTTIVSLEAIYLSIFIQMTINYTTASIHEVSEDIEEIQEDVGELQEDVEEISEDVGELQEDVEEINEDASEENYATKSISARSLTFNVTYARSSMISNDSKRKRKKVVGCYCFEIDIIFVKRII